MRAFTYAVDAGAGATILASFAGLLPPLAALAGIIWYGLQIYESKTVQTYVRLARRKLRHRRLGQ